MNIRQTILALCLGAGASGVLAAVPAGEAARLGHELTPFGAERAGNADGTIPAWDGGLSKAPAGFDAKSGMLLDPYAGEQPVLTIDQANMAAYAEYLSEGTKALLAKYGSDGFAIEVWPTHRSFAAPQWYYDNTVANAATATVSADGLKVENLKSGTPFPIPQSGLEVVWNHLLRWEGTHYEGAMQNYYIDASGSRILATATDIAVEYPFYNPGKDYGTGFNDYYMIRVDYSAPARRAGEKLLVIDPMDFSNGEGRRAWQYLKGQRRVRRAPSVAYDTPNPGTAGQSTYDDVFLFNGSPDRYDWRLLDKKEMYVPYNSYQLQLAKDENDKFGPKFVNPKLNRWERHRVWVVEGTLKQGLRHVYQKRVLYIDEDTWAVVSADRYDGQGKLWRVGYAYQSPNYQVPAGFTLTQGHYDLMSGVYTFEGDSARTGGIHVERPGKDANFWSGQGLAAGGVR